MALKDKLMTLEDFKAVRDVDVASNSAQFTAIKDDLENLAGGGTEQREIQFVYGSYINDGNAAEIGETVDLTNLTEWYSLKHAIVECQEGDEFLIDMAGATNARAWAFLTSNNVLLSRSNENETVTGKITAPQNAGKVIIQGIYRQTPQDTSTDEGTAYKLVQGTGKVVRFDISQDLTDAEKAQARANIGLSSESDILTERVSDLGDAICACLDKVVFENTDDGKQLIENIRRISHGSPASLTASFNLGSNIIYGYYTLASLKKYLTVTARYSNGATRIVTDYTLSGTLESENSMITVTYDGVTTTFNVNVNIGRALTVSDVVNNGGFNDFTVDANGSITFSSADTFSILTFPNSTHISFILTPKVGAPQPWWVPYKRITDNSQYYCNDGEKFFNFTKSNNKYNAAQASGIGTVIYDTSEQSGVINRAGMKIEGQTIHCYYRGTHVYTTNANILGLWQSGIHYGNITNVRVYEEV